MRIDGRHVRGERTRRAWTQAELATRCGVDVRTVQRLESSGQTSFATVQAIAQAFNMDPGRLIDDPALSCNRPSAMALLPTRGAAFWTLYALTLVSVALAGVRMFGWQQWFVLATSAAAALLVYGLRRHDLRAFGAVAICSVASMLWYFPLTLPATVFSTGLFLLLAHRRAASAGPQA